MLFILKWLLYSIAIFFLILIIAYKKFGNFKRILQVTDALQFWLDKNKVLIFN